MERSFVLKEIIKYCSLYRINRHPYFSNDVHTPGEYVSWFILISFQHQMFQFFVKINCSFFFLFSWFRLDSSDRDGHTLVSTTGQCFYRVPIATWLCMKNVHQVRYQYPVTSIEYILTLMTKERQTDLCNDYIGLCMFKCLIFYKMII